MGLLAGDLLVESARNRLRTDELNELLGRFSRVGDQFLKFQRPDLEAVSRAEVAFEQIESDLLLLRDDAFRFMRKNADGLDALHGNLEQLANQVAEARLVPLSTVVEAFPRAVRELANEQGKQIDLAIENSGVGVDRSMLADVRDALIHLLRNAIDHGIESVATRQSLGKPEAGKLSIRLRSDGDMLAVELADDGCGIDPEKLKDVAVARKVLTRAQATALSEREAVELIFRPGFSTREEVSDMSGRGVGMDVVKQKIEALGGSVTVQSRVGRGTTISLRLPQSLALMRVLLIRLGEDVYGVPAADVEAVARFKPEDRMEVFGTLAVMHRERPTAFVALGPLLGLNGGPRFERPPAIIVRHGPDRAALAVDGFVDEREVAVKPCGGELLKGAPFIAGTAALEDGRIAVLLHVPDIMAEVRKLTRPTAEASTHRRLRVLLVDDSPIARATEGALVKALGHHVDEAQDGEEAWVRIQKHPYDVILTDVQMPKLDGFALTKRIKSHADLASLPVIILSSLASPEDRRRGVDAGASGYLIKGELGVESLALAIERLV
jgi:chemotaxis protein histidine kinase CheA